MLVESLTTDPSAVTAIHRMIGQRVIDQSLQVKAPKKQPALDWMQFTNFSRVPAAETSKRNLDPELVWKYGVRWDTDNKSWVIPIVSPMGELLGWQSKKSGWIRNLPNGVKKSETLFGVERFNSSTAVLVESPLDVVRFASVFDRPQAVASFGAGVSESQMNILMDICKCLIIAMDNDEAGEASSKRLFSLPYRFRNGIKWFNYGDSKAKDIGEMSDDEIELGVTTATSVPPWIK